MEEKLISFEVAKLAKEKGFAFTTQHSYFYEEARSFDCPYGKSGEISIEQSQPFMAETKDEYEFDYWTIICGAPTQSLLQRWLREKHFIDVLVNHEFNPIETDQPVLYGCCVTTGINNTDGEKYCNYGLSSMYNTYEEALEAGLYKALELI